MKKLDKVQETVETYYDTINKIVVDIITPYSKSLDKYVKFIRDCLADGQESPTDAELEDWCLNLSTYIYFAGAMSEQLGIKDDISKAVYKEVYHSKRSNVDKGTIADKDSIAELESQEEFIINICYSRAYKMMKSKVENAQELLTSCKKALSNRMQQAELTRIGGN